MFNSTNPDAGGAPVAPSSAFAAADICVWKDGSAAQKASAAGITVTSPFDSIVGLHLVEIDTSNNTDAGFWTSGSVYSVRIVTAKTVATYSVSGLLIGEFSLEVQTARLAAITHTGAVIPTVTTVTQAVKLDSATIDDIAAPILAALQGSSVVQVASPNVSGNLVLTQGDDYDGVANPRAQWSVTTDYTTGWTVRLTIRDADDAVVYTTTGSVVSATVVAVTIAAPTGLTMTGCPGQWQGKFDVELTHSTGKKKTIALGTCYINEDQTRA
jgi:hypothetical protein